VQLPWPDQIAIVLRGVLIEKDKENARLMRRQIIRYFLKYFLKRFKSTKNLALYALKIFLLV
jgi:hypothetical protein